MTSVTSYPKERIKVLLLENIHPSGAQMFRDDGLSVETQSAALDEGELCAKIEDVHLLGIRSKTHVTPKVLEAARRLLAVGCYCIGTNQVALEAACKRGVVVFNAPFSNTRSVAELVLSEVIALSRQLMDASKGMHEGVWNKSATGSFEVRGKTLGIIGYGHIGRQVGVLAEALGMNVLFYDIVSQLPMGNNKEMPSLDALLEASDFVTLHVPATEQTKNMIGTEQLRKMRPGSRLLNLSRGNVVDIPALAEALRAGHLKGAAIDVFPKEPQSNKERFESPLQGLKNVILTPHVGGSTEEAQAAIGKEVTVTLLKFLNTGSTLPAVNFPRVEPAQLRGRHRILNIHRNVPGVLSDINRIISESQANVESQVLETNSDVGYLVMDLDRGVSEEVRARVSALATNIRTRILF
ncbi:MAG TPA: phosphoglycerate dehydrogenase [Polyangiaceae bacterium]|nr:phosphoglycerate dehydrogenase [Polyangiaceae bacterium]